MLHDLTLPFREIIDLHDQWCYLRRPGYLKDHGDLSRCGQPGSVQHQPMARSRVQAYPGYEIGLSISSLLKREHSANHSGNGIWHRLLPRPVRLGDLREPAFGRWSDRHYREILSQQQQSRLVGERRSCRALKQQGGAQTLSNVRCEPGKVGRFGERKVRTRGLTMQTHEAPAGPAGDERRAQFVSERERSQDLAIALAALQLALGGLYQINNRRVTSCHPGKLVHVGLQKLVLKELGCSVDEHVVNHRPREEQCRRISGGEKGNINRNDYSQAFHDLDPQGAGVESCMAQPDDLPSALFCSSLLHGDAPFWICRADQGFLSGLIIPAARV